MATWIAHLRVADKLLEVLPKISPVHYVMGNIAPDSGLPSPDGNGFIPPKSFSHNTRRDDNGRVFMDVDKFVSDYLTEEKILYYDSETLSFYIGYYHHLRTDNQWMNEIYNPNVNSQNTVEAVKDDWYGLDFLFLESHPDFRSWNIYKNVCDFENRYIDVFSKDAFSIRHEYIVDFYGNVPDNIHREYTYLSRDKMDEFVDSTAKMLETDNLTGILCKKL